MYNKLERDMKEIMTIPFQLNLQIFDEAGTLVNTTANYTNAYTGETTPFSGSDTLSPGMKTFYNTALLENARETFIYQQLGRVQSLPQNHGMTVEWRKFNTLPDCDRLQEAVIPVGKKLGQTAMTVEISEYGEYVSVSRQVELHHVDDVLLGATEELGATGGRTYEKLIRNVLSGGTNVIYADAYTAAGDYDSTPATRSALKTALTAGKVASLTPDMIAKATTVLNKANARKYDGNEYVGVIHPSCTYDLRKHNEWLDAHKYASPEEIYTGEIGKLHGVRFVETSLAPVIRGSGDSQAIYQVMIFGKDAFGVVDPAGAGMQMIHKSAREVGGPLEQFGTCGIKFSMAARILYPERMVIIECGSKGYGAVDEDNMGTV
ncbi:MAG: N4-gp56 family major capsid protein [Aristaeellaceae bacterium]